MQTPSGEIACLCETSVIVWLTSIETGFFDPRLA